MLLPDGDRGLPVRHPVGGEQKREELDTRSLLLQWYSVHYVKVCRDSTVGPLNLFLPTGTRPESSGSRGVSLFRETQPFWV